MRVHRPAALAASAALLGLLAAPALPGAAGAARVLAHAQLVASAPAGGSIVDESPDEIRLVFSEPLESRLTNLDLVDADGRLILQRAGDIDPADPYALITPIPTLADGVYSVRWRSLSAADGHPAEGFLTFGVGDVAGELPVNDGGMTHTERDAIDVAGRWLTYAGLLLAVGLSAFHGFVVRGARFPGALAVMVGLGLAVSALATLLVVAKGAIDAGDATGYLFGSRSGLLLLARAGCAATGALGVVLLPRFAGIIGFAAGLAGIGILVVGGHAAAIDGPAASAAGIVHVAGVGIWIGGLVGILLLALWPEVVGGERPPRMRDAVPRSRQWP